MRVIEQQNRQEGHPCLLLVETPTGAFLSAQRADIDFRATRALFGACWLSHLSIQCRLRESMGGVAVAEFTYTAYTDINGGYKRWIIYGVHG